MRKYVTKEMKPRKITQVYGVPGSTLRMKKKAVEKVVGKTLYKKRAWNSKLWREA